ncbi:MAG: NusG domain II-containing protein [Clostridiales bacterium]|nr:NusG domain II-containing protein [Clostridiales bacterium]
MDKLAKRSDILLILILFMLALVLILPRFFSSEEPLTASIYVDGELAYQLDLSKIETAYEIPINNTVIVADKNVIRFKSSDCKDKLCVNTGKLTRANGVAACLPNRVLIVLSGGSSEYDAITY